MTLSIRSSTITAFRGPFAFLSNFFPASIKWEGLTYPTVEHAFQAAKTLHLSTRAHIAALPSPREARQYGRHVDLRADWNAVRLGIMRTLIRLKFRSPDLRQRLVNTWPHRLIELNAWGDTFWGMTSENVGSNWLGRILMAERAHCTPPVLITTDRDSVQQAVTFLILEAFVDPAVVTALGLRLADQVPSARWDPAEWELQAVQWASIRIWADSLLSPPPYRDPREIAQGLTQALSDSQAWSAWTAAVRQVALIPPVFPAF